MRAIHCLLMLLLAAPVVAADGFQPFVSLVPKSPQPGEPFDLVLSGRWPDSCHPSLLEARVDGRVVIVRTGPTDVPGGCMPEVTRYQLRVPMSGAELDAAGTWQLRAYFGAEPDGVYSLFGFELFELGAATTFRPEAGLWSPRSRTEHQTSGPGTGFAMDFQLDRVTLMANVYEPTGEPTWLIGNGRMEGRIGRTDLMGFVGGQALFGDYVAPGAAVQAAQVRIEFHSRSTATLWLSAPLGNGPGILLQPLPISRFLFGHPGNRAALRGSWQLLDRSLPTLHLEPTGAGGHEVRDYALGLRLTCEGRAAPDVLPTRCRLLDDEGNLVAEFDDIGLDGMSGHAADGTLVRAVRLD